MIWLALMLLIGAVCLLIMAPWRSQTPLASEQEIAQARSQITALKADMDTGRISPEMAELGEKAVEARILEQLNAPDDAPSAKGSVHPGKWVISVLLAVMAPLIYLQVGAPLLIPLTEIQAEEQARQAFAREVAILAERLAEAPETRFEPYLLLARGHMRLDQFEPGLAAYDRALALSAENAELRAEVDSAYAYVARRTGQKGSEPDPEAVAAIHALPESEQAARIESMVAGLAARLEAEPLNPDGWVRLIRSYLVLEQFDKADAALFKALEQLAADPARLAQFEAAIATLHTEFEASAGAAQNPGTP